MQIFESKSSIHIRLSPIKGNNRGEHEQHYNAMTSWLNSRLTVHKDYKWSRVKYAVHHKFGTSHYPTGIYFVDEEDALAFKLAFVL